MNQAFIHSAKKWLERPMLVMVEIPETMQDMRTESTRGITMEL
ncbi:hypothetical protein L861_16750 [Litchfieldella anticariensis FP35 = DSM 16096]|uniref:Uncharacterized protein n=1 Tax=Litchfieldella anticariensis (strain DSM 16096 / CECT 5854 / CIP 108499 / LMG 22089 / FP35) TaxID=1121939 RepID=S2KHS7_LITA3|nr:hypothetical protein L861_16750 [Halomonas anticariensis FP35 = DSM 16096]